jgi:hypothetical protein
LRLALLAALCISFLSTNPSRAQDVVVRDVGPTSAGRDLVRVLAGPHRLILSDTGRLPLSRDSTFTESVVILGGSATLESRVRGDVFVIGGDLFVHPAARVSGKAVAIGGAVYPSALASIGGGTESFRDFTYEISREGDRYVLDYRSLIARRSPPLTFPGFYGVGIPTYDRSDGLSLPFSPLLSLSDSRVLVAPSVTYRSNLGAVDPAVEVTLEPTRRLRLAAYAGRATFTNEGWVWGDLVNSASTLFLGLDTRNYFRADRAELRAHRLWERGASTFEPYIGARWEHAWSVGPTMGAASRPWSFLGRTDQERMLRPNPPIAPGHIASALAGATYESSGRALNVGVELTTELAFDAPADRRFVQNTLEGRLDFPTFGSQWFDLESHVVLTAGETAPPQRWAYLGGAGTLPLLDLLTLGGDQLLFLQTSYHVPIERIVVPLLGSPTVTVRHILGSAGVGDLPDLHQDIGLGLALSFFRLQVDLDPVTRKVHTGGGLSIAR